jgi:CheY-like chemotaxis protein
MKGQPKILLVDDNPMVLRLLERALEPFASVTACPDPRRALEFAAQQLPDLILCDYRMPGMDGRAFLEEVKANPSTRLIPVILAASRSDLAEWLQSLRDTAADFLEKPFFVRDAADKVASLLEKLARSRTASAGGPELTVRGSLAQLSVLDLLQSLEMGRKTCGLLLRNGGESCRLYFAAGQINDARSGPLAGDEAVYRALAWAESEGSFEIDFSASSAEQTTTRSTQGLLMEGLRRLDESHR